MSVPFVLTPVFITIRLLLPFTLTHVPVIRILISQFVDSISLLYLQSDMHFSNMFTSRFQCTRPPFLKFQWVVISLLPFFLASCTLIPADSQSATPDLNNVKDEQQESLAPARVAAEEVMVRDLVSALKQILSPVDTTVQVSNADSSDISNLVAKALAQQGYGLQMVRHDQGSMLVSTNLETLASGDQTNTRRLRLTIGPMSISRSYELISDESIQPNSPFRLFGTRASIDVASTLFGSSGVSGTDVSDTEYAAGISLDQPLPALSLITPEIVQGIVNRTTGSPAVTSFNSSQVEVNNLYYSESTFSSILDNYQPADELVVIFPNDSIVMGAENRLLIKHFAESFNENDDFLSVVGCSNGPTASELGNVGLALGRAERVTTELVQIGIPRDKVLDEGCWAPNGVQDFPGRGVVIERWERTL